MRKERFIVYKKKTGEGEHWFIRQKYPFTFWIKAPLWKRIWWALTNGYTPKINGSYYKTSNNEHLKKDQ